MHRFQLDITPPKPGSAASKLTPEAWLLSPTMLDILGEKDLHIFREEQTSLSLDPAASPTDSSITTYHERVADILPMDRQKIAVTIPADNLMERIRDNLDEGDHQARLRLKVYKADLLSKYVDKVNLVFGKKMVKATGKGRSKPGYDQKSKIAQAKVMLDGISPQAFTKATGLEPGFRKIVADYEELVEERNKVVHDTEFEFARLLLRPQFRDPVAAAKYNCERWSKLLLWVTGYGSLKEMAAVAREAELP